MSALEQAVVASSPVQEPPITEEPTSEAPTVDQSAARDAVAKLLSGVQALMAEAQDAPAPKVVSLEASALSRPSSAPYNYMTDNASAISWSADAFGKSKQPGFYHQHRKQIAAHRRAMAMKDPKGTYNSHSKYADEANRIANTGRLAF